MLTSMANQTPPSASPNPAPRSRRSRFARWLLRLTYGGKRALLMVPLTLAGMAFGVHYLDYWWHSNFSSGETTGTIRKVSRKGPPYCKYVSAEVVLIGNNQAVATPETREFTLDVSSVDNPLFAQLEAAERSQLPVTIKYREDGKQLFWRQCVPTNAFVIGVTQRPPAPAVAPSVAPPVPPVARPGAPVAPPTPQGAAPTP